MKTKLHYFFALAVAASFMSCEKDKTAVVTNEGSIYSFTIEDNEWLPEGTKSQYVAGEGITVNGDENIALFRKSGPSDATYMPQKDISNNDTDYAFKAIGSNGNYTFTAPSGEESCTWYSLMPYSRNLCRMANEYKNISFRLSPVQFPEENSFDSHMDLLAGRPFTFENGATTASVKELKRLLAPLKLTISGLAENERVYLASLSLSDESARLTGQFYIDLADNYQDVKIVSAASNTTSREVTAAYPGGLNTKNGSCTVWYIVNSVDLGGQELTLTVSTNLGTHSRTVSIPAGEKILQTTKINTLGIDISGDGAAYTYSATQVFSSQSTSRPAVFVASNGNSDTWTATGSNIWYNTSTSGNDNGSGILSSINIRSGNTMTFPAIEGIREIRIYSHPLTVCNSNPSTMTLSYKADGVDKTQTIPFNVKNDLAAKGGYARIRFAGEGEISGLRLSATDNDNRLISAICFILEGEAPVTTARDYYSEFDSGEDILINGVSYNKADYQGRYSIATDATSLYSAAKNGGIVFVEGKYSLSSSLSVESDAVIIGRKDDAQAEINFAAGKCIYFKSSSLVLKNVRVYTEATSTALIYNNGTVSNGNLTIEDCTLEAPKSVIRDGSADYFFENVAIRNSIINKYVSSTDGIYKMDVNKNKFGVKSITVDNCVIYSGVGAQGAPFTNFQQTNYLMPDLEFSFTGNTVYNLCNSALNKLYSAKQVIIENNVGMSDLTPLGTANSSCLVGFKDAGSMESGTSRICSNTFYNDGTTGKKWQDVNSTYQPCFTRSGNDFLVNAEAGADSPFTKIDLGNGYFPVDAGKAAGRGASYETKLWQTWE